MFSRCIARFAGARHARARSGIVSCALLVALGAHPATAQTAERNAHSWKLEAESAEAAGQWAEAAADYEKAIGLAPRDASLRAELGAALVKAGQYAGAIAAYQVALRISPGNLAAEIGLAQAYRGAPNFDEAKRTLERAHAEHPKAREPLALLGDLDIELQTYDAAIRHLRAALALDPADLESRNRLAVAYQAKGDSEDALGQIAKVLARDPKNALGYYTRAKIYSDQNRDPQALADAEKVVELQPQNPRGRILLAKILLRAPQDTAAADAKQNCERAVAALEPLPATQNEDSETLFLLSRAYGCAGNSEEAQKTLAAFEASSQNDRTTKENQAQAKHLVQQANERALKNDFAGSLDLLQQAIALDPTYGAAYSQLAKLYYSAGEMEKASEAIAKALARNPYQPDFLYVQGKVLEKQGKAEEALAAFAQAALVNPKESDAYFEMGEIYQQRNDRAHALAAYKKAVELSPEDADYQRALAALSGSAAPAP
jgi:tetratricopeptide (TPR) repeat protein